MSCTTLFFQRNFFLYSISLFIHLNMLNIANSFGLLNEASCLALFILVLVCLDFELRLKLCSVVPTLIVLDLYFFYNGYYYKMA